VENWHWHQEVKTARQAIHHEIAANEANLFARRLAIKSCVDRQLREAETILADLEAGRKPGRFTTFHLSASGPASDGEWQAQRAAQTLTHFPPEELALMGSYYKWVFDFEGWTAREEERWSELVVLRKPPAGLSSSDIIRLRSNLTAVHRLSGLIENNSLRALKVGDALGIARPPVERHRQQLFCSMDEENFLPAVRDDGAKQR
jgi:hypothetical protein